MSCVIQFIFIILHVNERGVECVFPSRGKEMLKRMHRCQNCFLVQVSVYRIGCNKVPFICWGPSHKLCYEFTHTHTHTLNIAKIFSSSPVTQFHIKVKRRILTRITTKHSRLTLLTSFVYHLYGLHVKNKKSKLNYQTSNF